MAHLRTSVIGQSGFSLVELMIALTIGLLLLSGLTVIFVNSSESSRELQKTAQQIENGRYAIDIITQDLHHAGYYGHLYDLSTLTVPAAPDPCETASTANLRDALTLPVLGYRAPDLATAPNIGATTCDDKGLFTAANLSAGSDVLVVRRLSTRVMATTDTAVTNEIYMQARSTTFDVKAGNGAVFGNPPALFTPPLYLKDGVTPAPIRKYVVHVYFVAPCSVGSGANGVCTAADDTIPTLKRLELGSVGGATTMSIVPLVEGIEYLKVEYGVDTAPSTVSVDTGLAGDGTVDAYVATPADWTQVIAAKIYVLARNTDATAGFTDDRTYLLGTGPGVAGTTIVAAANDRFKRHAFTASVRIVNAAGRREIP